MWTHIRFKRNLKEIVDKHVENLIKTEPINTTGYVENAVRSALKKDGVSMK